MATESTEEHGKITDTLDKSSPRRMLGSSLLIFLDDSLSSPCRPPFGRSMRDALLSGRG